MQKIEILIPSNALIENIQSQSNNENTPTKQNTSRVTTPNGGFTYTPKPSKCNTPKWRCVKVVGESEASTQGQPKKIVVRTETGQVFRVKPEDVNNKPYATTSPTTFVKTFQKLILNTPNAKIKQNNTNRQVAATAKTLLNTTLTLMSRDSEENSLCVSGQTTVFLSRVMDKKLTRLGTLYKRTNAKLITQAKKQFIAWREYVYLKIQSSITIQALGRRYLARKKYVLNLPRETEIDNINNNTTNLGELTNSLKSVIALQSYLRGYLIRKKYAQLLLYTLPGNTTFHKNIEHYHTIMKCVIELRDSFECERVASKLNKYYNNLEKLHVLAWDKNVISTFNMSLHNLLRAVNEENYETMADVLTNDLLMKYEDVIIESREAAGCNKLKSLEKLIKLAQQELKTATLNREFHLCHSINCNLQRLMSQRDVTRDEETLNFSKCSNNEIADGTSLLNMTETDRLRQDLNNTREMVRNLKKDTSHLDGSYVTRKNRRRSRGGSSVGGFSQKYDERRSSMTRDALHLHNRRTNMEDDIISNATSMFSTSSKMTSMPLHLFTYKITNRHGQIRKFRSSATKIHMLMSKIKIKSGMIITRNDTVTLSFVDEDGDTIILLTDDDLIECIELERASGSTCVFIQYNVVEKSKMCMTQEEKEESEGNSSGCTSSSSSSSDSGGLVANEIENETKYNNDIQHEGNGRNVLIKRRSQQQSDSDSNSSSSSSESESENDEEASVDFPNASMFPKSSVKKMKQEKVRKTIPLVLKATTTMESSNLLRRRAIANQKRQRALNANKFGADDVIVVMGSVVVASALAALSVLMLVKMKK